MTVDQHLAVLEVKTPVLASKLRLLPRDYLTKLFNSKETTNER